MGIGFLPQQSSIFRGAMTVFDNIYGIAQISRKELSNSDRRNLTENLMAEFSITHLRNVRAISLSGGERRRLEICRCLITNPRVLLLDEPMAGVDLLSIQDIKSLLLKLQSRPDPVSCIISDHNASQLLKIVDRAVVIANGTIVANDSPRKLVNHPEARRLYFGKDFTSF
jgi:lipopolysaccharide export system ATP-binding protein